VEETREETLVVVEEEDNPLPLKDQPQPHNKSLNCREMSE
jgi:hypothetical protein